MKTAATRIVIALCLCGCTSTSGAGGGNVGIVGSALLPDSGGAQPEPEAAAPSAPHPPVGNTPTDTTALRTLLQIEKVSSLSELPDPLAGVYLCCLDDSTCSWDQNCVAPPGHILINVLSLVTPTAGPSGAVANTITSPPFHGLCFSEPGNPVPVWCETITAVGGMYAAKTGAAEDVGTLVTVSQDLAGSPVYQYEPCYLPGTLASGAPAGCTDMGGYCCYPPHSMGALDQVGNPPFGIAPGDYWFGFHTMPDVATAGPIPFAQWGPNGNVTPTP